MEKLQDIEIISKVLNGQTNAYRLIIDKHKTSCFNLANRILCNREDAEECTADAFMNAYKSLAKYDERMKLRSWLLKIVYNRAISMRRKNKIATVQIDDNEYLIQEHEPEIGLSNLILEDNKKIIDIGLKCLDEESRAIVNLFYYEELSIEEIANITAGKSNTIKSKLFRARQKMNSAVNRFYRQEERIMEIL